MKLRLISLAMLASACGPRSPDSSATDEAWNQINDPSRFGLSSSTLDALPRSGAVDTRTFWSGDYWPTYKGGIAHRWQSGARNSTDYRSYQYTFLSRDEAARLTPQQIARLSPAEKYDIFLGRLDFPLARAEWANTVASAGANGQVPTWCGLCHGWAAAALADLKPGAQAVARAADGRTVTFYAADLEALAVYVFADVSTVPTASIGARCEDPSPRRDAQGRVIDPSCRDTNPASFHLAVIGGISAQKKPFVMDTSIGNEV